MDLISVVWMKSTCVSRRCRISEGTFVVMCTRFCLLTNWTNMIPKVFYAWDSPTSSTVYHLSCTGVWRLLTYCIKAVISSCCVGFDAMQFCGSLPLFLKSCCTSHKIIISNMCAYVMTEPKTFGSTKAMPFGIVISHLLSLSSQHVSQRSVYRKLLHLIYRKLLHLIWAVT